jgi:hypothetical protein
MDVLRFCSLFDPSPSLLLDATASLLTVSSGRVPQFADTTETLASDNASPTSFEMESEPDAFPSFAAAYSGVTNAVFGPAVLAAACPPPPVNSSSLALSSSWDLALSNVEGKCYGGAFRYPPVTLEAVTEVLSKLPASCTGVSLSLSPALPMGFSLLPTALDELRAARGAAPVEVFIPVSNLSALFTEATVTPAVF